MSTDNLFLAVTIQDGSVYTADRSASSAAWSLFQPIPGLSQPGRKNLSVSVTPRRQVCTVNDAALRLLRTTHDNGGGWSAPVRLATGVAPAAAHPADGAFGLAALAIGRPARAGWSFGLPLFLLGSDGKTIRSLGDQADQIAPGDLEPGERGTALDIAGTFNNHERSFHLCLITTAGKCLHAFVDGIRPAQFSLRSRGVRNVSCAMGREGLHVCLVSDWGRILHFIRRPDGIWSDAGQVNDVTRTSELFQQVAISHYDAPGRGGVLHVVGVTRTGGLFHAMRTAEETADPLWSPFVDIKALAGDKGVVTSVDIAVTA